MSILSATLRFTTGVSSYQPSKNRFDLLDSAWGDCRFTKGVLFRIAAGLHLQVDMEGFLLQRVADYKVHHEEAIIIMLMRLGSNDSWKSIARTVGGSAGRSSQIYTHMIQHVYTLRGSWKVPSRLPSSTCRRWWIM